MGNHESEDNVWSLVNHDLSIARKGLERAMEGAKAAGARMAADNAELERLRSILAGRIEPVGTPGMILAGLTEEFVAADDRRLTTRQGHRYARKDGIDVSAEYRITPSDLAKINAKLNDRPSYAVQSLMAFEESTGRS